MRLNSSLLFIFILFTTPVVAQNVGPSPSGNIGPFTGTGKTVLNRNPILEAPDIGIATGTSLILKSFLKLNAITVARLPKCEADQIGYVYLAVDAKNPSVLSKVTGGGNKVVPVYCDGENWIIN